MLSRLLTVPGLPQGGDDDVTAPTQPSADQQLAALRQQIAEALAEVRGARATHEHCPSHDNEQFLEAAEWRLNRLLDRLPREARP